MSKQLFVVDPVQKLNLKIDTSIHIAKQMHSLGDEIFLCELNDLEFNSNSNSALAHCITLDQAFAGTEELNKSIILPLSDFSLIHMRKEPPVDADFSHACRLLAQSKSNVINDPTALLTINEKLAILEFPEFRGPCLISTKRIELKKFLIEHGGDGVLKPLDGFGGKGVRRVSPQDFDEMAELKELMILQPFQPEISQGELRVFAVAGKTISWCLKKPAEGSFLANTSSGATLHPYEPTQDLINMVNTMNKRLLDLGITFVGYDIIGDKVSEINITSCLLYTSPSPRDKRQSRMPSSA